MMNQAKARNISGCIVRLNNVLSQKNEVIKLILV
jgi:hypothetical protein